MRREVDYGVWVPRVLAVLRIMVGLLFLEHGTQKIFGFPASANPAPTLLSLAGIQGCLEVLGGILIVIGLFTRPVAFVLCSDMAVSYFISHSSGTFISPLDRGDSPCRCFFVVRYVT